MIQFLNQTRNYSTQLSIQSGDSKSQINDNRHRSRKNPVCVCRTNLQEVLTAIHKCSLGGEP